jgi:hypothetical protein
LKEPDHISATPQPLEQCGPDVLTRLYRYWDYQRNDLRWLPRSRLRPEEFHYALPYIALIERPPEDGSPGLMIRLVGEDIRNQQLGYIRGNLIENMSVLPWYRDHLIACYRGAFATGQASFESVRVVHEFRRIFYNRLILPLTVGGERVDILMVATMRTSPDPQQIRPEDPKA